MTKISAPVVLITGAARRVGAVIAQYLHAAGYDLAIHYRHSVTEARSLQAKLESHRSNSTHLFQADLANISALPALVADVVARFGRLDALVNNASSFYATPVGTVSEQQWDDLFASNAKAPFFLAQAAAAHLRASSGCIINMIDIYAERPLSRHPVYCMAKAALAMMTRSLARELGPEIRVNGIAPGAVMWPETGKAYADQSELIAGTPLKRAGSAEDIASTTLFLLRDSPFITGHIIHVDGGRSV